MTDWKDAAVVAFLYILFTREWFHRMFMNLFSFLNLKKNWFLHMIIRTALFVALYYGIMMAIGKLGGGSTSGGGDKK